MKKISNNKVILHLPYSNAREKKICSYQKYCQKWHTNAKRTTSIAAHIVMKREKIFEFQFKILFLTLGTYEIRTA